MSMIRKAILSAILLLVLYNLKVYYGTPSRAWGQNQWQNNIIKAQNYLYGFEVQPNMVLGSSMAANLEGALSNRFTSLAFRAGSARLGLKLLSEQKQPLPQLVLIELNTLFLSTELDQTFANDMTLPGIYETKGLLPALQEKNQPVTILSGYVQPMLNKLKARHSAPKATPKNDTKPTTEQGKHTSEKPGQKEVNQDKVKQEEVNKVTLLKPTEDLLRSIRLLKEKGCKIIFFEIPQNTQQHQDATRKATLQMAYQYFPPEAFTYVLLPKDLSAYQTSDGVHLDGKSAVAYVKYLNGYLPQKN